MGISDILIFRELLSFAIFSVFDIATRPVRFLLQSLGRKFRFPLMCRLCRLISRKIRGPFQLEFASMTWAPLGRCKEGNVMRSERTPARQTKPSLRCPHLREALCASWLFVCLTGGACGCTSLPDYIHNGFKVGPNFKTPPAPVAPDWIDAACLRRSTEADDLSKWWTVFEDRSSMI